MKKIIKLSVFMAIIGGLLGWVVFEQTSYSRYFLIPMMLGTIVMAIVGLAEALNKDDGSFRVYYEFIIGMTKTFKPVTKRFYLKSLPIAGLIFGFFSIVSCLETKSFLFILFPFVLFEYYIASLVIEKPKEKQEID
ncbi:MAG: hypothetical protein OEX08_02890 [Candidatus Nomurabacteria bacterium]|nr:hypothetical protein [Candidatus Nomurabacteria bacterium]